MTARLRVGMKVWSPYPTEGEGVITAIDINECSMGYVRVWVDYANQKASTYSENTVQIYRRAYLDKRTYRRHRAAREG